MRKPFIIATLFLFLLASCQKEKDFPLEPVIQFNGFTKIFILPDTIASELVISITFTDGDGDVGLFDFQRNPPYEHNLFIDMLTLVNGEPEFVIFPDSTFTFNGRIPMVLEENFRKPIEGVINYNIDYKILRSIFLSDTVAFDVSIKDRALNRSNIIRTPYILID